MAIGSQKITADGVGLVSAQPTRLFNLVIKSGDGGAGAVTLYNGTSTSGAQFDIVAGTQSVCVRAAWAGGLLFPDGLYLDVNANTDYVVISAEKA